jgi:NADPH-dependent 2,4-dienoyl-CoA reductase/sulfur reductase-like enzyme
MTAHDVVIVGGGPAGLSAARRLAVSGVRDVVVLERESEAGGIPRHCGHTGFGIGQFLALPMSGPAYARRLVEATHGIEIRTRTTVTAIESGGRIHVTHPDSEPAVVTGRCVLLATGIRETPRSARLVSGTRPWGLTTTGALQQFVYLKRAKPFARAVIVGTELVSFSALLTARHGGIAVAAMLEEGERITARRPGDWIARHVLGVPVLTGTRLVAIRGLDKVEAVEIERAGRRETIACDGVVFTGRFQPETAILRGSNIALDPGTGGPAIDQYFRCSDLQIFAAGNLLRPVETSGLCWAEGRIAAANMILSLQAKLPEATPATPVTCAVPLKYVYPQRITAQMGVAGPPPPFRARVSRAARGRLRLLVDGRELWSRGVNLLPERRITIPTDRLPPIGARSIHVDLIED